MLSLLAKMLCSGMLSLLVGMLSFGGCDPMVSHGEFGCFGNGLNSS